MSDGPGRLDPEDIEALAETFGEVSREIAEVQFAAGAESWSQTVGDEDPASPDPRSWVIQVCRTCGRLAAWPFCEHRTAAGWTRHVVVTEEKADAAALQKVLGEHIDAPEFLRLLDRLDNDLPLMPVRHLVWAYPKGTWDGRWLSFGSDEMPAVLSEKDQTHYRLTLALRLPGERCLVIGLWKRPLG